MALTDLSQGVSGGGGIGINDLIDAERVEYITLTLADVANKYFEFTLVPGAGGKVKVATMQGNVLHFGTDYSVDAGNKRIGWNGLTLDGLVEAGDVFQVVYLTTV